MVEQGDLEDDYVAPMRPFSRPFSRLRAFAGAVGRTAASAGSILADADLRGQARALVSQQAGQGITSLREGVQYETDYLAKRINSGLGYVQQGPKHVQAVLARLQKRIEETRLQALLEAERDAPVDVQIGPQLVEEAPQELRSRLWLALMANPELCHTYQDGQVLQAQPALSSTLGTPLASRSTPTSFASSRSHGSFVPVASVPHLQEAADADQRTAAREQSEGDHASAGVQPDQAQAAPALQPDCTDPFQQSVDALQAEEAQSQLQQAASQSARQESPTTAPAALPAQEAQTQSQTQSSSSHQHMSGIPLASYASALSGSEAATAHAGGHLQLPLQQAASALAPHPPASSTAVESGTDVASPSPVGSASTDAWEMVQDTSNINNWKGGSLFGRSLSSRVRQGSECSEEGESYSQCLMNAVTAVSWPISQEYSEESRYNTLLQISVGQEEVDEVIGRDINRTFPEHPQFGFEQGQQALYRVLKAYSLHDLEVGYCQGMAFVAGVVLMYLPEEAAFRVLCQLLDEDKVGLRSLYLPGLQGLKEDLRMLDWLMERLMPDLKQHLENYGAVPVLYASQWFLTIYSHPFPATFSCRVIDVMLTEHSPNILMRAALAVLAECEEDLLKLHDFEDLITYLKVEPVQWSTEHTRTVLTSAINSPKPLCSIPMIEAARLAVQQGYEGTMHRRPSSVSEVAAAVSQAAAAGVVASAAQQATSGDLDGAQQHAESGSCTSDSEVVTGNNQTEGEGQGQAGRVESEGPSRLTAPEIDANQAMGLALGPLWTGSGSGSAQLSQQELQDAGAR